MNNFDFFSHPPNIFIFKKYSNKTTFGGVLFLIYITIMIGISFIFIIDYVYNEKYVIEYSSNFNTIKKTSSSPFSYLDIFNDSYSERNPIKNIRLNLFKINETSKIELSERFVILDAFNDFAEMKRNTTYQKKISEFGFIIVYMCEDENCMLNEDDYSTFDYYVHLQYDGFELDHKKDIPLNNDNNIFFQEFYLFSFDYSLIKMLNWQIIKYKEIKGISRLFDKLLGKKNEYINGYFSLSSSHVINHPIIRKNKYIPDKITKVLGEFLMTNALRQYEEYKRRKISFLDVLANIGALFMSLYYSFGFMIKYYSKKYDNYKIVKTIINKNINYSKKNIIELKDFSKDSSINNITINKNKTESLIYNKNNNFNNNGDEDTDNKKNKKDNFKKISFVQFFLNIFYCKKCGKNNKQEIIRICNELVTKYFSVESLLYNQIMLNNLFKDYKWNHQELNNIESNVLISKIKKFFELL